MGLEKCNSGALESKKKTEEEKKWNFVVFVYCDDILTDTTKVYVMIS